MEVITAEPGLPDMVCAANFHHDTTLAVLDEGAVAGLAAQLRGAATSPSAWTSASC